MPRMAILRFVVALGYFTCVLLTVSAEDQYEAPSPPSEPNTDAEPSPARSADRVRRDQGKDEGIDAIFGRYAPKQETVRRERDSYYYRIETPASVVSVWRPAAYRLHRPYFIPIFGAEGHMPIYFPPQQVYINAYPSNNPPCSSPGKPIPGYLPPQGGDTDSTDQDIGNRFGQDDRPVWDRAPSRTTSPTPTRRPSRPGSTTFPPLVHNEPTIAPSGTNQLSNREGAVPVNPTATPKPSQCVWAIVNCCAAQSQSVNSRCFERFGCPGPFWDNSPCDSNFAKVAIQSALNYYGDQ